MPPDLLMCFQLSRDYLRPWTNSSEGSHTFKRYYLPQHMMAQTNRLQILVGPRGIGKTTSLLQLIWDYLDHRAENTSALYLPIDHFKLKGMSLYEIGEAFANYGGKLLCIDEIHKYENWAQELKSLYESFGELRLIVSGSSVLEIQKASHDLSRRAIVEQAYGMSFREYLELKYKLPPMNAYSFQAILSGHETLFSEIVNRLEERDISVLTEFDLYLKTGYYPYFYDIGGKELFWKTLEQQVHATIESDIPSLYPKFTAASTKKMVRLLAFIAQSVPYEPGYRKLKEALDIGDERTLKEYLKILEDAMLIQTAYRYRQGFKKVEEIGKIYLQNTNLQWALSNDVNKGTLRETFMLSMLKQTGLQAYLPESGDFLVRQGAEETVLEIGGRKKTKAQVFNIDRSYLVADDMKFGIGTKIPLWVFGFLY